MQYKKVQKSSWNEPYSSSSSVPSVRSDTCFGTSERQATHFGGWKPFQSANQQCQLLRESMQSRVCERSGVRLSVCPSVRPITRQPHSAAAGLLLCARRARDVDRLLHGWPALSLNAGSSANASSVRRSRLTYRKQNSDLSESETESAGRRTFLHVLVLLQQVPGAVDVVREADRREMLLSALHLARELQRPHGNDEITAKITEIGASLSANY